MAAGKWAASIERQGVGRKGIDRAHLFRELVAILLAWDAAGKIPPMPHTAFPLHDAPEAHRLLESGTSLGKLVLLS